MFHYPSSANLALVETERGGNVGLAVITLQLATFHILIVHVIIALTNLRPTPVISWVIETLQVVAIEKSHKEQLRECKDWRLVKK